MAEKAGSRNSTAEKIKDGYMNMDYGASKSSAANIPLGSPLRSCLVLVRLHQRSLTPSRVETSLPVRITLKTNEDKQNSVVSQPLFSWSILKQKFRHLAMERHLQCYTYQLHSKQAELWKSKNCLRFGKGYYWTKTTQYSGDKPNIAYFYCLFFF